MQKAIYAGRIEAMEIQGAGESSRRGALAGLSLSMLLSSLGTSVANVALPTLAGAFGASFQEVQWVVLAYLIVTTSLIVSAGRLGDAIGRRRLLLAGILVFTVASIAAGSSVTLWMLVLARAVQGVGAATMLALTMAFVGDTIPREQTGRAMGLLGTMSAVGTALGPSLGGILIAGPGWRTIFLLNVPLGALAFLLAYQYLPAGRSGSPAKRVTFDSLGTVLLALTFAAYALAMTMGRGHFGSINVVLLTGTVLGLVSFVMVEKRVASPLIRPGTLRDPALSAAFAMSTLVSTVMMATLVVGPFYLSLGLGLDAALVGLVMAAGPLIAAFAGIPAGRAVDQFGSQTVILIGLTGIAVGAFIVSVAPRQLGAVGYLIPIVIVTASYALFQVANNTAVMTGIREDLRGVTSGMLNLSRNLGLVSGASMMGMVFVAASGGGEITMTRPADVATGTRVTFLVAALLMVAAIAVAVLSRVAAERAQVRG